MNDIDFKNIDKLSIYNENALNGLLLQSKIVEWACLAYMKHNMDVAKACTWLLRTVYPVSSTMYEVNIYTEQYNKLKKYYNDDIPSDMAAFQNIYDCMVRQSESETSKKTIFESKSSLQMDGKVVFSAKNFDINTGDTYMATSLDKTLQLKTDTTSEFFISNIFEIMSYVFLIDKVIFNSNYITGVPPIHEDSGSDPIVVDNISLYINVEKSNILKNISTDIKKSFINITCGTFSRFIAIKYKKNTKVGLPLYSIMHRKNVILFLCDLLIDFYKYTLLVDTCDKTFDNTAVDACKKEIELINGDVGGTFEKDQKELYSYTMSMFCPRPSESESLFNLIDAEVVKVKYSVSNGKIDITNKDDYKGKNAISRLFSPRGSASHYILNLENFNKILDRTIVVPPGHGVKSAEKGIEDILTDSVSVIDPSNFENNLSGVMKINHNNKEYPTSNMANSCLLGGNFNDIVNSILLIGNSGFISTFGVVDFQDKDKNHGVESFFNNTDLNFKCNEFFTYPIWKGSIFTDFTLAQAFNIHDNNISINELNYNTYKIKFDNKFNYTDSLVRCSISSFGGGTVSSFIKSEKHLNEFYKPFISTSRKSNDLSTIFYSSPGEHSFLINEYYYIYNKNEKVDFKKLSESFCPVMNSRIQAILNNAKKEKYNKMELLYITKIPIFNVFRVNLLIKYLCKGTDYIFSHIDRELLDEDLKKYYNNETAVSMKKFELNK